MWILQWLPNWIFYGIFFAGLLGLLATYVMKFIPFVYVYRTPIQVVSVLAIAIGTYMSGAISNEESWKAKVREMEAKVAAAEIESQKENIKVIEKVVKKTEYITRRGQDIIQYVDREVVKYDERFKPGGQCELPKEFIKAINNAAEAPK
jgi:translation elongation factor EF-Tu-like GTPase